MGVAGDARSRHSLRLRSQHAALGPAGPPHERLALPLLRQPERLGLIDGQPLPGAAPVVPPPRLDDGGAEQERDRRVLGSDSAVLAVVGAV